MSPGASIKLAKWWKRQQKVGWNSYSLSQIIEILWAKFLKIPTKPEDFISTSIFNRSKLYFKRQLYKILQEEFEIRLPTFSWYYSVTVSHTTQQALFESLQARQGGGNCITIWKSQKIKNLSNLPPPFFLHFCVGGKEKGIVFPFSVFPLQPFHLIFVFDCFSTAPLLPDLCPWLTWCCIIIMEGSFLLMHAFLSFILAKWPYQTATLKNKETYYFENNCCKYFAY